MHYLLFVELLVRRRLYNSDSSLVQDLSSPAHGCELSVMISAKILTYFWGLVPILRALALGYSPPLRF